MKKKRITLKELARLCNTSVTAVSRALSGKDGVSEETRERIRHIANQHNYRPNLLAKSMRSLTTNLIGIVVGDITRNFVPERYCGNISQSVHGFLIVLKIIIELVGIPLQYLDGCSFDERRSDISHWIHL